MRTQQKKVFLSGFGLIVCSAIFFSFNFGHQPKVKKLPIEKCFIVSDIHFNPFYGSSSKDSVLRNKLATSSLSEWKAYFESSPAQMAVNSDLLFQDANYAVLKSALYNMKKKLPNPAFIIIGGDFIWHGATPADSVIKKKSILFIAQLFKDNFPDALIIPALGNNDTYGRDYEMQDAKFLNDFASAWQSNMQAPSTDSLKKHGYYTCETGNLKLVVINSALVDAGSNYTKQANDMISWLQNTLANNNGKNIWILMHIPPGSNVFNGKDFWRDDYNQLFVNAVVKNASKIKFIIAAHTHLNDFKVIYDNSTFHLPVSFIRVVPSICSNHGNNPSFEIAAFNPSTGSVVNETNWYLNLSAIPKDNGALTLDWTDTLNSRSAFKMTALNAAGFSKFISMVKKDKTGQLIKDYCNFYDVGTKADSSLFINRKTYMKYLKADSLVQQ